MICKYVPRGDETPGRFHLVLDEDLVASLCDDYCAAMNAVGSYYPEVLEILTRMNFLYFCEHGCSIIQEMEEYERLEEG